MPLYHADASSVIGKIYRTRLASDIAEAATRPKRMTTKIDSPEKTES